MSQNLTVEELVSMIQREKEQRARLEQDLRNDQQELERVKSNNAGLVKSITHVEQKKRQMQKEVDVLKATSANFEEKNSDYIDQIELALSDVQLGDMSIGDLNRLHSVYLNELTRVNRYLSKLTNKDKD